MRITRIDTWKRWGSWCNWLFVRISTDEGVHGWGEGSLHGAVESVETAIHELAPLLVGQDPAGVERHWQRMYHAWRWRGGATLMTAMGALDIALWDIEGKRLGVPVYRLLGGPFRERLPVYASHWLSGVTTPDGAFDGARDAMRRGFRGFKWSPFRSEDLRKNENAALARAAELMAAAREGAGPDAEIYVECSERLSPRTAARAAVLFAPYRPAWFEEPIPFENPAELCRLQQEISVPIATGERLLSRWEVRPVLEGGGCRVLQPDVMHAGGLTEAKRIATYAGTHLVSIAPHNPGGPICNLAAIHLAAAIPNFLVLEEMEEERSLRDSLCTDPVAFEEGCFRLPSTPGLGSDLLESEIEGHEFRPQAFSGSSESLWS